MTPATKRKLKQQAIERVKQAVSLLGYKENRHGKWINDTGTVRWEFGGNNLKRQRKTKAIDTVYSVIAPRWVNSRSVPYSQIKVELDGGDGRPKLIINKDYNYGYCN